MLRLESNITISRDEQVIHTFTELVRVNIRKSYNRLTDTATIVLNNKVLKENKTVIAEFQRGDEIDISLGYAPLTESRFQGFITAVTQETPVTLICEDAMWTLKQKAIPAFSTASTTLAALITSLKTLAGVTITANTVTATIGSFKIENQTFADALAILKDEYGLYSWIRLGELFIGRPEDISSDFSDTVSAQTWNFNFEGQEANILPNHNLVYRNQADIDLVVKGVSTLANDSTVVRYAHYEENAAGVVAPTATSTKPLGDLRTFKYYNISQSVLDANIKRILPSLNYTGYRGSFTTFGDAIKKDLGGAVWHGDTARLASLKQPERDGDYLIKEVDISFDQGGYRQVIELDKIV